MATIMNRLRSLPHWVHCITRTGAEYEIADVTGPADTYTQLRPTGRWRLTVWGVPLPWIQR